MIENKENLPDKHQSKHSKIENIDNGKDNKNVKETIQILDDTNTCTENIETNANKESETIFMECDENICNKYDNSNTLDTKYEQDSDEIYQSSGNKEECVIQDKENTTCDQSMDEVNEKNQEDNGSRTQNEVGSIFYSKKVYLSIFSKVCRHDIILSNQI